VTMGTKGTIPLPRTRPARFAGAAPEMGICAMPGGFGVVFSKNKLVFNRFNLKVWLMAPNPRFRG